MERPALLHVAFQALDAFQVGPPQQPPRQQACSQFHRLQLSLGPVVAELPSTRSRATTSCRLAPFPQLCLRKRMLAPRRTTAFRSPFLTDHVHGPPRGANR